jgi:hypothetical protein
MLTAPSCEQARLYLKRKGNSDAIIFIDNCFRDIDALLLLLEASHLQVIAFDRDYSYESRAFMLRERNFIFDVYDVTEINEFDARKIIDSIPAQIKNKKPSILITDSTIFSILSRNTNGPRFEKRFAAMIDDFYKNNQVATEVFVMICYVHACGVPVSLDMVISFLRDITDDYREVYKIIGQVGGIIKSCSDDSFNFLNINFQEQD